MVNFYRYTLPVLLVFILQSCHFSKNHEILTCKVERIEFTDILSVDGTVEAIKTNSIQCPNIYNSTISYLAEDGSMLKAGDTACIIENMELVNRYEQILKDQEQQKAELNKSKANLALKFALLEAEVKNNEAQAAITNLDSIQLKYTSEVQQKIILLELKRSAIQKKRLENKLAALQKINKSEIRKIELQIKQKENQLNSILDKLKLLVIFSPQDGLFLRSKSMMDEGKMKEGDKVFPGMAIAEIPDLSSMRIKFSASENEYKRIQIGDSVLSTFDAIQGNFAMGKVTFKAPIGQPRNENSKIKYYEMLASIDSFQTVPGAGLSANCKIFIEKLRDTLVAPLISVFDEDSLKYVFVKTGDKFEKREVIVGDNSPERAVISAGVSQGEVLTLSNPSEKEIKNVVMLSAEIKEKVKKMQALKQSQLTPQINGEPPRSGSGSSSIRIIYY